MLQIKAQSKVSTFKRKVDITGILTEADSNQFRIKPHLNCRIIKVYLSNELDIFLSFFFQKRF